MDVAGRINIEEEERAGGTSSIFSILHWDNGYVVFGESGARDGSSAATQMEAPTLASSATQTTVASSSAGT